VSLVGPNGAGKTTLIDTLAGKRPLAAGKLATGHNVKLGHLSQHADELGRGPGARARTVLEACAVHTGLTPNKARALLGRFLFSGEEAEKPLEGLSGGERRRLSLAILVSSGANVLILDEPTNHLDLESREALEDALSAFDGAVLLVSHDRALLDAVAERTLAIDDRTVRSYEGGWAEYVARREESARSVAQPVTPAADVKKASRKTRESQRPQVRRPSELERLEAEIAAQEASIEALEQRLAEDWSDVDAVAAHKHARDQLEALLARWERLFEASQA
jgi:ATP-binding cassette, subfamily F, member 3